MKTESSIALNGVSLDSLDESIVIKEIKEEAPTKKLTVSERFSHYGQDVNVESLTEKKVKVSFTVIQNGDKARRFQVIDKVTSWAAGGGKLTVNYRINQYLQVRCEKLPAVKGEWSDTLEVSFRADEIPQWQALSETKVTASGNTSAEMFMNGTAETLLSVEAKNNGSSEVTWLQFGTADEQILMANIGLGAGETFRMDYDENLVQRFRIKSTLGVWRSVLNRRYFTASDDVHLKPGKNEITLTATSSNVAWVLSGRGRWFG